MTREMYSLNYFNEFGEECHVDFRTHEALLDVVTGKFKPNGKMPFSTPISEEAAQNQKSDVPGYMEGSSYALFHFDEGLTN